MAYGPSWGKGQGVMGVQHGGDVELRHDGRLSVAVRPPPFTDESREAHKREISL